MRKSAIITFLLMIISCSMLQAHAAENKDPVTILIQDGQSSSEAVEFPSMLPGDTSVIYLDLKNTTLKQQRLYLKVQGKTHLLSEEMQLKILYKKKVIYEGAAHPDISNGISLGIYEPAEQGELVIKISLPTDSDNQYNIQQTETTLIFLNSAIEPAAATGYESIVQTLLYLLIASGGILMVIRYRKEVSHEKNL